MWTFLVGPPRARAMAWSTGLAGDGLGFADSGWKLERPLEQGVHLRNRAQGPIRAGDCGLPDLVGQATGPEPTQEAPGF